MAVDSSVWALLPIALLLGVGVGYALAWLYRPVAKPWSLARTVSWLSGVILAVLVLLDAVPFGDLSPFAAHMVTHLVLGMVVPLLLVWGAPVTLVLRALPQRWGRRLSRVLIGSPVRWLVQPVVAGSIMLFGLVALYRTPLYSLMHDHAALAAGVHLHFLAAGYLFTASIVSIDPVAHRSSFRMRAAVLVLVAAGHAMLAKSLYASPPSGVNLADAQLGSQIMYYGGDGVELLIAIALCWQWYRHESRNLVVPGMQTLSDQTSH